MEHAQQVRDTGCARSFSLNADSNVDDQAGWQLHASWERIDGVRERADTPTNLLLDHFQATRAKSHGVLARNVLKKGAESNAPEGRSRNTLQTASPTGRHDIVQLLFDKHAILNVSGFSRCILLSGGLFGGHAVVIKMLLEEGAVR